MNEPPNAVDIIHQGDCCEILSRLPEKSVDLGYWLLNEVTWIKDNSPPHFRGVRFTNAHETLLWSKKSKDQEHCPFHYQAIKMANDGKQMRTYNGWERWHYRAHGGSLQPSDNLRSIIRKAQTAAFP